MNKLFYVGVSAIVFLSTISTFVEACSKKSVVFDLAFSDKIYRNRVDYEGLNPKLTDSAGVAMSPTTKRLTGESLEASFCVEAVDKKGEKITLETAHGKQDFSMITQGRTPERIRWHGIPPPDWLSFANLSVSPYVSGEHRLTAVLDNRAKESIYLRDAVITIKHRKPNGINCATPDSMISVSVNWAANLRRPDQPTVAVKLHSDGKPLQGLAVIDQNCSDSWMIITIPVETKIPASQQYQLVIDVNDRFRPASGAATERKLPATLATATSICVTLNTSGKGIISPESRVYRDKQVLGLECD